MRHPVTLGSSVPLCPVFSILRAFSVMRAGREGGLALIPKHALDPRDNFVAGGIRGFVEVDDAGANVGFEVPF